nr:ribonuclease H-like domain-containing protein [Tanacetum cinerariifolium]
MSNHEDETITEENAPPKVVTQIKTVTNFSTKFPYLKKGEYDIWAMKMQNFISNSDLLCWNIILNGNSAKSMTTDNDGNLKIRPPVTEKEHQQVQREEKARTILLSALPDEHMGYDKMQKILTQVNTLKIKPEPEDVNMKFLRGLPPSWSDLDQMNKEEFKEYDLKHQMEMLSIKKYKSKETRKDEFDFKAMVVVDDSIDWDKQTEEGNTEPRSLENFGMIAGIKIESDVDSEGEVVFANDAIPSGVSVSAGNVVAAVVSPQFETEFALMGLSTEAKWNNSGKNLYKLIDSFMSVRTKRGLGLDKYIREGELGIDDSKVSIFYTNSDELFASVDHMRALPPPLTGNYMPPSNIPDINESQMVYRKKATDSSEIKTNDDNISYSNDSVLFDFSDRTLEFYNESNKECIETLKNKLETLKQEKEGVDGKLASLLTASKDIDNLIESQRSDKNKEGLGYNDTITDYSRPSPTIEIVRAAKGSKITKVEAVKKSSMRYVELYRKPLMKPNVRGNQRNLNNLKSHQLGLNFVMMKKACFNCGDFNHLAYDCRKRGKKNFTPRPATHIPYRPPMRPNMNSTRPNKPAHLYGRRPFQETTQELMIILIQRVQRMEKDLKARTPIHKVDRGRSRPVMAWVPKKRLLSATITLSNKAEDPILEFLSNHSDHDSTDSISSVSASASESRHTIVIDCDRQEDFPSVCSIETDVKSSKTLCNKFGSFNKESHLRKHKSVAFKSFYVCGSYLHLIKDCDLHEQRFTKRNAEGKVSAGQPNQVSAGPPNSVSAKQQNTVSAGQPNPVSAGEATLAYNSIPLSVFTGDGILGPRPLNIQPKSTYFHSFTHNNQQIIFPITHNSLYLLYMTGGLNGKTVVKPSAGWPWKKYGMSKTKGSKINGGSKSKSWSYDKGPLGRPKLEKAKDRGIVDSGCSRSMSGNKDKLEDFKDFDGGEVTFGGSTGKISGKGTIKTKNLNFENVLYGIRRDYSNARTPQQNEVAERKNRTLIEAARTMLAAFLLPTLFWSEAVATACYVLNR